MALTTVQLAMTKKLISVPMGTPVPTAIELMEEKRIRHLPIVDAMGDIVGMLSNRDVANCDDLKRIPVELFMTSPVEFIDEQTPLKTAALKMLENKISCLLVSDKDENAVGILTTDDLLWYLTHLLKDDELQEEKGFGTVINKETVGQVANQLSNMGI
ncbi:MAG: HPP family protein [Bdellovibrio sp.]|jgi:CBS domain-containing protein